MPAPIRIALCCLAAAFSLAACQPAAPDVSPPAAPTVSQPVAAAADEELRAYQGDVPGAALLVIHDGEAVVRRGFGLADLETARAVTPATAFRLASISKQFTATAVLLLAQDGVLSIDDPARRWLPELPASADAVTLRHLLSHTSGLLDYEDLMDPADTRQVHDADVLDLVSRENGGYFDPGTGYRYSNSGYALLALIVERASGQRYADFLRERIFLPLGMDSVAFEDGRSQVPERAFGYSFIDGGWRRTDQSTTSAVLGDGGIYASIDDLARWDAALYDERLLHDPWRTLAVTPATATDEPDVAGYGFGWRLQDGLQWHSGESIGFRNVILRWPAQRLTVVLLTNRNDPEPYALARRIAARWQ